MHVPKTLVIITKSQHKTINIGRKNTSNLGPSNRLLIKGVFSRELNSMNTLEICAVISLIIFFNITSARPRPRELSPHIFSDYLGDKLPSTNYDRYDLVKNRFANDERAVVLVLPDDQLDKILIGNVADNDQQLNRSTFWKLSDLQKVSTTEDVASLEEETTTDFSTEEIEICEVHFCDNLKTSSAMTTTEETTIQTSGVATESTTEEQTSEPKTEETTTEETTTEETTIQTTEATKESTTEEQTSEPKTEETTMETTEVTKESTNGEQTSEPKTEETMTEETMTEETTTEETTIQTTEVIKESTTEEQTSEPKTEETMTEETMTEETTTEETTIQTAEVTKESTTEEQTSEPKTEETMTEETTTEETTIQTTEVTTESIIQEQTSVPKTEETMTEETTMQTTEVTTESIFQEQTSESKAEETTTQTTVVNSETTTQNAETTEITRVEKGKMKPAILPMTEHVPKMKSNEQSMSTMDSLKLPTEIPCLCEILDFVDSLFDNIIKQMALLVENSEDKQEQEMINRLVYKKNKIIERYRPRTQCRSVFSKDQVADFAGCFDPLVAYAGARKDK
ncbi:hypothetical protein ACOME3_002289 [Neoechinorhynchus agilis]